MFVEREAQNHTIKVGKCEKFCPANEYRLRVRERLIHKFESSKVKPYKFRSETKTVQCIKSNFQSGFQLVKQFSRPAAGQKCPGPGDVRSPECLVRCVSYLVTTVMQAEVARTADLQDLYDFMFDRLRAVRQDMVLQAAVPARDQLLILGVCVRFHVVMGHLLARHASFSAHLNSQHQLDCLKSCLLLQGALEEPITSDTRASLDALQCLYLLSNLDSTHAVNWAIHQPRSSGSLGNNHRAHIQLDIAPVSGLCLNIARSYREGNYVRFFKLVSRLPTLFLLAVFKYCKTLLGHTVSVNRLAYKSPNIKFPCDHLAKLLWVSRTSNLESYLRCQGFKVEGGFVWFGVTGDTSGDDVDKLATDCFYERISNQVPSDSLGKLLLSFNC